MVLWADINRQHPVVDLYKSQGGNMAEVVVLGAGTPTPTATRFGSSYALRVGGELLMFDCGPVSYTHLTLPTKA